MKKINICTLNGNGNYGNKLQHYALQTYIQNMGYSVDSTLFIYENYLKYKLKILIRHIIKFVKPTRFLVFRKFDKKIVYSKNVISKSYKRFDDCYDYYIVGSDQVWNPTFPSFNEYYLLPGIEKGKRISYAASFGVNCLPEESKAIFERELPNFNYLSVREDAGKEIIKSITKKNDIEVLLDPTMLLTSDEWSKLAIKPKKAIKRKFILNYFIGELSEKRKKIIYDFAEKNDCVVINLLDRNDPYYLSGPSEFLWLEKNAFLICTDSFHSSVFAILFDKDFIVFEREDKERDMYSRIDTLLSKFNLVSNKFNGSISTNNLKHNYSDAYAILEVERKKSKTFLEKSLN